MYGVPIAMVASYLVLIVYILNRNFEGVKNMQPTSRFQFKPYPSTDSYEGYLSIAQYSINSRTAIQLFYFDNKYSTYLPYATLTVNIPSSPPTDNHCVYIDTYSCPFALNLLLNELKCAELTGHVAQYFGCDFPEVRLITDKLYKCIYYKED